MNSKKDFSKMSKEERQKALFEMPDEDIDFSDIPELDEEFFKNAKRVKRPLSRKADSIIKPHLIDWFKNHAKGKSYEALINDVLEDYVEHQGEN